MRKTIATSILAAMTLTITTSFAATDTQFPTKPIRLVVPLATGGGGDTVARLLASDLQSILGQPIIVDNRPGGSTIIGTRDVVGAAPDGYTLVMATSSHVINPALREMPFDAANDFEGVSLIATTPALLIAHPNVGTDTVEQLIQKAKSAPGKLTYGSSGIASSPHLSGELFNLMAGTQINHIPYKGMGPALNDLVGQHIDLIFSSPVSALPLVESGKLKAIATTGPKRPEMFSNVPTIAETLPGYQSQIFYLVLAPKGTPAPILDKLSKAFATAAKKPQFDQRIRETGGEVIASTPEQARAFLVDEIEHYKKLVKQANIQVN